MTLHREFIYETAPFPSAHASTIAETPDGLVAAWFGGRREGHSGVEIWVARRDAETWSAPTRVASGRLSWRRRHPCWNPVLHQNPSGTLLLFYKVGPRPSRWWGMLTRSDDGGRSWSEPERLPEGMLGPIKNKPVRLGDDRVLCPSSSEHAGWRVHLEHTCDRAQSWQRSEPLNDGKAFAAIQPTIVPYDDGRLHLLCRSRQGVIVECWSEDGGGNWSAMRATSLPNPDSGIDALRLQDGRALMIYNHSPTRRTPLNLAVSNDGEHWRAAAVLEDEPGEFSYPAIIQGADARIHITYTWNRRRIRYVALTPESLSSVPIINGLWPMEVTPRGDLPDAAGQ